MLHVTKPSLPSRERLDKYIDEIYKTHHLTSNGPLLQLLEKRLKEFLGVKHLLLCANGTLALQIAFRALGIKKEAITTPFTYVATASALLWEGIEPRFADIDASNFNLSPLQIKKRITNNTTAIVPVHVFGNPCDVEEIDKIARENNLKVIYDAAHAFAITYKDKSILNYGDASIVSFQATKVFNTAEGALIAFKNETDLIKAKQLLQIGFLSSSDEPVLGLNAKMNDLEAALGNANLDEFDLQVAKRKEIWEFYKTELESLFQFPTWMDNANNNYSYFPALLSSEEELLSALEVFNRDKIFPRRYFYPSIHQYKFLNKNESYPISEDISKRILCLPLSTEMTLEDARKVTTILRNEKHD
jgi:dTDP-4-amino-4,6-dideoxygalactose transaminase